MKLATVIALLALFLAFIATAESYYVSDSSCMKEMQRRSLNRCRSFMKYGRQQQQSLIWTDEDDENMQAPEECCMQLKKVSEECRCPMIRHMTKQMKQEEGFMGQECTGRCREMMMKAKFLPAMCDMEPHTCRMRQGGQM